MNKQLQTADNWWSSDGVGRGANNSSLEEELLVMKSHIGP